MSKATRDGFGDEIVKSGASNPRIFVIGLDLEEATKIEAFKSAFPDRYIDGGIAEANGISMAAGMALNGERPFVASFGSFITGRYDQIRQSVSGNRAGVVIVGSHGGLAIGYDGNTQMGLEDVGLMRGLPYMNVIQPADYNEMVQAVKFLAEPGNDMPCYLRILRQPTPVLNGDGYQFEFGKGVTMRGGKDLTLIASGGTVYSSLQAADLLKNEGIDARVVNIHTIKPLDENIVRASALETGVVMTVEDHNITNGLGSAVAETLAESGLRYRFKRHGVPLFGESGKADDLYRKYGLDAQGIASRAKEFYRGV